MLPQAPSMLEQIRMGPRARHAAGQSAVPLCQQAKPGLAPSCWSSSEGQTCTLPKLKGPPQSACFALIRALDGRPHSFKAVYSVSLHGEKLRTDFRVFNTCSKEFEFTAALHSYFEVTDVSKAKVNNLQNLKYLDKVCQPTCNKSGAGAH